MTITKAVRLYLNYLPLGLFAYGKMVAIFMVKHTTVLIIPIIAKFIIDDFIPAKDLMSIYGSIAIVAVAAILNFYLHRYYSAKTAEYSKMASRSIRSRLIQKLQLLSLQYHLRNGAGKLYSKIMVDVEKTERFANILFNGLIAAVYTFIFSFATLMMVNVFVTMIFFLFVPFYLLIHRHFRSKFKVLQREGRLASENLSKTIGQFIETNTLSRVHGQEDYEHRKVDRENLAMIEKYTNIQRSAASFQVLISGSSELFLIIVVAVSAHAIILDWMQVGALVLFMQYIRQMINSSTMLLNHFPDITAFTEAMDSIEEIFSVNEEEQQGDHLTKLDAVQGHIEFKDVEFHYEGQRENLFDGLNVQIMSGETVALVGASGSGKTTFVNLCLGLFQPLKGSVSLDGHGLRSLNMRQVRHHVGVVTQQPIIFRGSVYDNIAYGQEDIDRDGVVEAAKKANAHEFIAKLPFGYDSDLGEHGGLLSGGQRQRIAIARSIFRKPSLLVLDEATSALDPDSEREVQKGIEGLLGRQTTLVIAHRLSTIFRANRILVFSDGKIIEEGHHNQLIDLDRHYAHLLKTQMGIESDQLMGLKF